VARDVRRARAVLNFSELGPRPGPERRAKLFEAIEMIAADVMPPSQYRALHRDAVVQPQDLAALKEFAATLAEPSMESAIAAVSLADIAGRDVKPASNGMAFPRDLATWTPVELSERWDNGTLRVILGNASAREAAKSAPVVRWPEGTSFAKVAWKPGADVEHSAFVQIEVMQKQASSWGWARWVGRDLTPYGHDPSFADECIRCHAPMRERDSVYSFPQASFDPSWGAPGFVTRERRALSSRNERGRPNANHRLAAGARPELVRSANHDGNAGGRRSGRHAVRTTRALDPLGSHRRRIGANPQHPAFEIERDALASACAAFTLTGSAS
jgi:hypothetical protein